MILEVKRPDIRSTALGCSRYTCKDRSTNSHQGTSLIDPVHEGGQTAHRQSAVTSKKFFMWVSPPRFTTPRSTPRQNNKQCLIGGIWRTPVQFRENECEKSRTCVHRICTRPPSNYLISINSLPNPPLDTWLPNVRRTLCHDFDLATD